MSSTLIVKSFGTESLLVKPAVTQGDAYDGEAVSGWNKECYFLKGKGIKVRGNKRKNS